MEGAFLPVPDPVAFKVFGLDKKFKKFLSRVINRFMENDDEKKPSAEPKEDELSVYTDGE